jgi:Leucine-rich repeat (LRR) protein
MVDLSHNELLDLAPATFLSQLNLLLVDVSHNRLVRTPYAAFSRRVATVLLQGVKKKIKKCSKIGKKIV